MASPQAHPMMLSYQMTLTAGRVIALGAMGAALALGMMREDRLRPVYVRSAITVLLLAGLPGILKQITYFTDTLTEFIEQFGDPGSLTDWILQSYQTAAKDAGVPDSSALSSLSPKGAWNLGTSMAGQTLRSSVWLLAQTAADFFYAASAMLIESGRMILWSLTSFLAPLLIGFTPIFPRLGVAIMVLLIEVALWEPVLRLMQIGTFPVVLKQLSKGDSLGIAVIAAEWIAICLFCMVPMFTHLLVSGALTGASLLPSHPFPTLPKGWGTKKPDEGQNQTPNGASHL
jgi:hypothetical protein